MYRQYRDRVAFLLVYIREAHPADGWQVGANLQDQVIVTSPRSSGERSAVAQSCQAGLHLAIPMLIDGMDNAVETAYAGWPDRLYVVGIDGKIAYKGAPGPGGFRPEEMRAALDWLLAEGGLPDALRAVPGREPATVRVIRAADPAESQVLALPATLASEGRSLLGDEGPVEWKEIVPGRLLRYEQTLAEQIAIIGEVRVEDDGLSCQVSLRNLTDRPLKALRGEGSLTGPAAVEPGRLVLEFGDCAPGETATASIRLPAAAW
ncbi:MAG: hypothetical protein FJX74_25410 [Armatimonadetes bacterium]|nr:hypothetical protein [Armatimonadota bacterium]